MRSFVDAQDDGERVWLWWRFALDRFAIGCGVEGGGKPPHSKVFGGEARSSPPGFDLRVGYAASLLPRWGCGRLEIF
ncbi:MAG TPA: hypothetical protein VGD60_15240 [Candidatus Acidoferrales bacterium]